MNWMILIDAVLILLLLVTAVYAFILNKKLSNLRNAKDEMNAMVREFSKSAETAERALAELREKAGTHSADLQKQVELAGGEVEKAVKTIDDLSFLVDKGNKIADRLEKGISEARPAPALRATPIQRSAAPKEQPEAESVEKALEVPQASQAEDPRKAFLKALEAVR